MHAAPKPVWGRKLRQDTRDRDRGNGAFVEGGEKRVGVWTQPGRGGERGKTIEGFHQLPVKKGRFAAATQVGVWLRKQKKKQGPGTKKPTRPEKTEHH